MGATVTEGTGEGIITGCSQRKGGYAFITAIPLSGLLIITTSAAWQKLFSPELRIGFLAHASDLSSRLEARLLSDTQAAQAPQLIFNDYLDATLTGIFLLVSWILAADTARVCWRILSGQSYPPLSESPHIHSGCQYMTDFTAKTEGRVASGEWRGHPGRVEGE